MTRKQQIFNAATKSYGLDVRSVNSCFKAFSDGAEWADIHSNWHKFPDEKPPKAGEYIVSVRDDLFETESVLISYYEVRDRDWAYWTNIPGYMTCIAWMEKPQPPKFS